MTTMNLPISEEMRAFIDDRVSAEGHASAVEYRVALVRDAQLLEGLRSPSSEMTAADWDRLRRRVGDRHSEAQAP